MVDRAFSVRLNMHFRGLEKLTVAHKLKEPALVIEIFGCF